MDKTFADDVLERVDLINKEGFGITSESHHVMMVNKLLRIITGKDKTIEELKTILRKATCFNDRNHGVIPDYVDEIFDKDDATHGTE